MQAALMMALSVGLVSSEVRGDMPPGTLLTTLNRKVHPHTQRNWMNTAFSYLTITPIAATGTPIAATGPIAAIGAIEAAGTPIEALETSDKNNQQAAWSVRVANAGLIAPLLCRKGLPTEWIDVKGLPLGIMPEVQYEQVHIILEPGDVIVLCSDGLVEAMNQDKSLYGFERLAACVASAPRQHAHMTLEHVLHDVQAFVDGAEMYDDLTIIIVKIQEE
jgi:serine phosphatase RsbU (regulator of sigma subunit)